MTRSLEIRAESLESDPVYHLCRQTLAYSRERDYTGWDKVDGLSSRLVRNLPVESKWLSLLVQEGVKRAPVNLRPYLLVEQRRNCKGAALFASSNLSMYALTGEQRYADEARRLLDWLVDQDIDRFAGFSGGGHRHPMMKSLEQTTATDPDELTGVVSLSYTVSPLLEYAQAFDEPAYAEVARRAVEFVEEELGLARSRDGIRVKYLTDDGTASYTLNANAIAARLYLDLYDHFGVEEFLETGTGILEYVAAKQTAVGGWMYMDPPTASHLSMDNYHNGFIIDAYQRYRSVTDSNRFDEVLDRALDFYRNELFEDDGAPNWDESNRYPHDVNAAAQGIVVFSTEGEFDFAERIIDWTGRSLYAGDGQFYYQQRRFYTKRFTLMRWCQAWMAYGLSTYLAERYTASL